MGDRWGKAKEVAPRTPETLTTKDANKLETACAVRDHCIESMAY